ncbi:hypothetical protein LTR53_007569 [Teratosphaeriaceae sp. CCFEE 6253]|nr:hypothetical protein LTR53_007569 [Teratosphaeriaceae sp. CCFEE 6253]
MPAAGNGSSYDWACNNEWAVYSGSVDISDGGFFDKTMTATLYTASLTTLCDGHTRIIGDLTPTATTEFFSSWVYSTWSTFLAKPSCHIAQSDCVSMQKQYAVDQSASSSAYSSAMSAQSGDPDWIVPDYDGVDEPLCTVTGTAASADYCGACTIGGGNVQLLYFPVTQNISRDMCATAPASSRVCPFGTTIPGDQTNSIGQATAPCSYYPFELTTTADSGPYIVSAGTTYYQDRAYISYENVYASNSCGTLGQVYRNSVVPVASSNVYSMSGYHYFIDNRAYPFNFADLSGPVPVSAYFAQAQCGQSGHLKELQPPNQLNGELVHEQVCNRDDSVIYDAHYFPVLAVPPELRALDPAWSQCLLGLKGLWDPPKALQPVSTAAAPTVPGQSITTTTASPAQTPDPPASTTAAPITTPVPAESDGQGSSTAEQSQGGGDGASPTSQAGGGGGGGSTGVQSSNAGGGAGSSATSQANGGGSGGDPASSGGPGGANGGATTTAAGTSGADQGSSGGQSSGNGGGSGASPTSQDSGSSAGGGDGNGQNIGNGGAASPTTGGAGPSAGDGSGSSQGQSQGGSGGGAQTSSADPGGIIISVINNSETAASSTPPAGGTGGQGDPGGLGSGSGGGSGNDGTAIATIGSSAFTVGPTTAVGGSSVIVVGAGGSSATLPPGQATSIGGQAVSAPSSGGAVIGTGGGATTVAPGSASPGSPTSGGGTSVVSVGSSAFTVVPAPSAGSSGVVVAHGGSTVTLAPGSSTTLGGQVISAPTSGGAVIGTGSGAATVAPSSSAGGLGVVATVGGQILSADPSDPSAVVVDGQTLTQGLTTTISGTLVSVASGSIVVGGSGTQPASTIAIPTAGSSTGDGGLSTTLIVDGHTLTASADSSDPSIVVVDGTPVTVGGSAATMQGVTVSLAASGLLADGSVVIAATPAVLGTVTANSQTLSLEQVGGQTLVVDGSSTATMGSNGRATVAGVTLSVESAGGSAFVVADGSQTVPLLAQATAVAGGDQQAVVTIGSHTLTVTEADGSASDLVVDGTTLHPGGAAITVDGTVLSVNTAGLVIGGTQTVPSAAFRTPGTAGEAVVTLGGSVLTAIENSAGYAVLDGTTLNPGGPAATINGVVVGDAAGGLVVGAWQTVAFSTAVATAVGALGNDAELTLYGHTVTAVEPPGQSYAIVDGTIISPGGPAVTIDGVLVSDGLDGLVIGGTSTVSWTPVPTASASEAVVTIGGHIYTAVQPAGASFVIIDGTTLSPGGAGMTIDGIVVSDGAGSVVVGGTRTVALSRFPTITSAPIPGPGVTVAGAGASSSKSAASSTVGRSRLAVGVGLLMLFALYLL